MFYGCFKELAVTLLFVRFLAQLNILYVVSILTELLVVTLQGMVTTQSLRAIATAAKDTCIRRLL